MWTSSGRACFHHIFMTNTKCESNVAPMLRTGQERNRWRETGRDTEMNKKKKKKKKKKNKKKEERQRRQRKKKREKEEEEGMKSEM